MDVDAAVIARAPRRPTLDACLAALGAAGAAAPRVVEVGPDGPAQARNRALAATAAEVLALVEDDVVVAPGWLDAVRAAFADDRVAVAGGPLEGPPGTATVSAESPTYPGGNVAFRAAALRGAGGFWPARGHPDARDWFSEEHEAQRELARQGWRLAFVENMAARRVGGPPSLWGRFRTGARRQVVGEPRPAGAALRALATGLAGAPFGRGRERLGRAAENLGVLRGARVVRGDFTPVARETPFRPSVPMPQRHRARGRGRRDTAPTILIYHRIAEVASDPLGLAVTPAHFAEQLDVLRAHDVVPLAAIAAGDAGPDALAVTFDDGYADNLVLRDAGIPVTLFVSTGHVAGRRGFWWDAVDAVCRARAGERVVVEDRAFVLGPAAAGHLRRWLQPLPPKRIDAVLAALDAPSTDPAMGVEDLLTLGAHVTVGAHTRTHRSLRHAPPDEQRAEIEGSRDDVAAWLGAPPMAFAYPYGVPGDAFDETTKALVREARFTSAVANAPHATYDRYALPRHAVPDVGGDEFARWLSTLRA